MLKEMVLVFMRESAYKPLKAQELFQAFSGEDEQVFLETLTDMEKKGEIVRTRSGRYGVPEKMNLVVGRLEANSRGYGFVVPDNEEQGDLYISGENINGAMHKDRVIARIISKGFGEKRNEGEIIRVLEHKTRHIVGKYETDKYFSFVTPEDRRYYQDILVYPGDNLGAINGEMVLIEVTRWGEKRRVPEGRVIQRIGMKDTPGVDVEVVMAKYGLQMEFPGEVVREVESVSQEIQAEELEGRWDLRQLLTFTIDGEDARDLDDAISLEILTSGPAKWRLGVHIADVAHYVQENTQLDKEAQERATSVYLVDRVIPMLPTALSNGICSLHPHVDRLTMSIFMNFTEDGKLISYDIGESVIQSKARLTYTQVQDVFDGKHSPLSMELQDLLREMLALSDVLREVRKERGGIDFDFPEVKVSLDKEGNPVEILKVHTNRAHKLIEDFMLAANETIAEHYFWLKIPFLYRVHEIPDEADVRWFAEFLHNLGYKLKRGKQIHPKAYQEIAERVRGTKVERLVSTVLLRSLQRAKYDTRNLGHFGLAAQWYTHFTSPIRRYPDLQIHRIIKAVHKRGQLSVQEIDRWEASLPDIAKVCSERERAAEEAERESTEVKLVAYMKQHEGEIFSGTISGVTNFGLFVELSNMVEGLVHVSNMVDDYYEFFQERMSLIGERNKKVYQLGDIVKVQVVQVNIADRTIDLLLVDQLNQGSKRRNHSEQAFK